MSMMPDPDDGLPRLVRLYIKQALYGFVLSAIFVAMLLGFNVANLRHLMFATHGGWIAGFMLFFFNGLVFAGVQFAISIMRMAEPEDKGPKGGHRGRTPLRTLVPIRIRSDDRR